MDDGPRQPAFEPQPVRGRGIIVADPRIGGVQVELAQEQALADPGHDRRQ